MRKNSIEFFHIPLNAGDRNRTCTVSHKNLNLACLPISPHPHTCRSILLRQINVKEKINMLYFFEYTEKFFSLKTFLLWFIIERKVCGLLFTGKKCEFLCFQKMFKRFLMKSWRTRRIRSLPMQGLSLCFQLRKMPE